MAHERIAARFRPGPVTERTPLNTQEHSVVPELDAGSAVEAMAVAEQAEHEQPVLPKTTEDLIRATIMVTEGADTAVLEDLSQLVNRVEGLQMAVGHLEQRLRVYLTGQDGQPSQYAKLLMRVARGDGELTTTEQTYLRQIQGYLVNEINPIVQELQAAVTTTVAHDDVFMSGQRWQALAQPDGVWQYLQTGRLGGQRTQSLFGVMQQVNERDPQFVSVGARLLEKPQGRMVSWAGEIDPLSSRTQADYWQSRLEAQVDRGSKTIAAEVLRRSDALLYELDFAAEQLPATAVEQSQAYAVLADWIERHTAGIQPNMTAAELKAYRATLHFAHGEVEDVMGVINAAEVVKQANPQLFLRMIGVAPGYSYNEHEAQRSDLFGSVFQLALHRSLHLQLPTERDGLQMFQGRVRNLLDFSASAQAVPVMSAEQMHALEAQFQAQAEALSQDTQPGMASVFLAAQLMSSIPGYKLRYDLERMLAGVSLEEHDRAVTVLTESGPREFLTTVLNLSKDAERNVDIMDIIWRRTGFIITDIKKLPDIKRRLKKLMPARLPFSDPGKATLYFNLWVTAPDVALTTPEFFADLQAVAASDTRFPIEQLWRVLEAHDGIAGATWRQVVQDPRIAQALRRICQEYSITEIANNPSHIFAILTTDVQLDTPDRVGDIRGIYDKEPNAEPTDERYKKMIEYQVLQKAFLPDEFVERYGHAFVREDFRDPSSESFASQSKLDSYFSRLSVEDREQLLHTLLAEQNIKRLGWDMPETIYLGHNQHGYPVATCEVSARDKVGFKSLHIDTLSSSLIRPDGNELYRALGQLNFWKEFWPANLLDLASHYIREDAAYQAIRSGETKIDPIIYHVAYPLEYELGVNAARNIVRLGYITEARTVLTANLGKDFSDMTADSWSFDITQLPINDIKKTYDVYPQIIQQHLAAELNRQVSTEAEALAYIERLERLSAVAYNVYDLSPDPTEVMPKQIYDKIKELRSTWNYPYSIPNHVVMLPRP